MRAYGKEPLRPRKAHISWVFKIRLSGKPLPDALQKVKPSSSRGFRASPGTVCSVLSVSLPDLPSNPTMSVVSQASGMVVTDFFLSQIFICSLICSLESCELSPSGTASPAYSCKLNHFSVSIHQYSGTPFRYRFP